MTQLATSQRELECLRHVLGQQTTPLQVERTEVETPVLVTTVASPVEKLSSSTIVCLYVGSRSFPDKSCIVARSTRPLLAGRLKDRESFGQVLRYS